MATKHWKRSNKTISIRKRLLVVLQGWPQITYREVNGTVELSPEGGEPAVLTEYSNNHFLRFEKSVSVLGPAHQCYEVLADVQADKVILRQGEYLHDLKQRWNKQKRKLSERTLAKQKQILKSTTQREAERDLKVLQNYFKDVESRPMKNRILTKEYLKKKKQLQQVNQILDGNRRSLHPQA